nr:nucleotidyltransferase domain-containing protein [Candidatus Sigynarchaeota archaeon]
MVEPVDPFVLFRSMIEGISKRITLHAVVLFGSRAKGKAHKYSDYDLLVIGEFKESLRNRWDWVVQLTPDVSTDIFCLTPAEFAALFDDFNITAIDAIGDGIILHGTGFIAPYKERYNELVHKGMRKTSCMLVRP